MRCVWYAGKYDIKDWAQRSYPLPSGIIPVPKAHLVMQQDHMLHLLALDKYPQRTERWAAVTP